MSFSLRTDHFQLCSEAVDEVVPSGVAPEEDEGDVEHEHEEAKRQMPGGDTHGTQGGGGGKPYDVLSKVTLIPNNSLEAKPKLFLLSFGFFFS